MDKTARQYCERAAELRAIADTGIAEPIRREMLALAEGWELMAQRREPPNGGLPLDEK